MAIILDLIVIGIIGLFTFLGYKQGLVKAAIKILSFFIAIVVALVLYKPVSSVIINNTPIEDNIKNMMIEKIAPEGVNENQKVDVNGNIDIGILGDVTNTVEGVSEAFAIKLVETFTLLIIYLVVKIALKFVSAFTDLITKLPLLKQINELRWNNIWINKRNNYSICIVSNYLLSITYDEKRTYKNSR